MIRNRENKLRYIAVGALFIVVCLIYMMIFIDLQISGQDYYTMTTSSYTKTRKVKIQAQRGEVYDRNGNKLIANKFSYDVRLDYGSMPTSADDKNEIILSLLDKFESKGEAEKLTAVKYTPFIITAERTSLSYTYNNDFFQMARASKYQRIAGELGIAENATADEAGVVFADRYGLLDEEGMLKYSPEEAAVLFAYNMDFDLTDFSAMSPYFFAEDISLELITSLKENVSRGFTVYCDYTRVYNYPGYASHILGRVGKISSDNVDYYTELGYPLDAVVGLSGVEYSFENYLRGVDGELTVTEDLYGNVIKTEVTKEPVAGLDVYLTIDIEMQKVAEDSLHENILFVQREAAYTDGERDGEDARAGALTAMDPDTGEVLVLASYPTYDLATYTEDVKYLNTDETSPLLNRALQGLYQPGSTFKPGVALAALEEEIITPYTIIDTKGQYTKYGSGEDGPRCWLYLMYNDTHGPIDVTEAIQESCNYFFYQIGDEMTIDVMNRYMKSFGLGEPTGIELTEKTGVLASPETRTEMMESGKKVQEWVPGDTLAASIGQSDHLFSPLQITSYISTLVNDGERYSAHILQKVCRFGSGEVVFTTEPEIASTMEVSSEACDVVRNAMRNVIENGSASEVFEDYEITIGGKTGTAQVSKTKSDNAIFTAFAPFDDPQIVTTCVIEQGNTGSNAGVAVKGLFDYYFGIGDYAIEDSIEEVTDEE